MDQSARLDLVRRGVRQPDRQEIPVRRLWRPDRRGRRGDSGWDRGCRQSVRHRRIGRRRVDRLDRRQDRPVQGRGDAEAGDQLGERGADDGQYAVHLALLVQQAAMGGSDELLEPLAAQSRRQRQDADPGRGGQRRLPHAGFGIRAILRRVADPRRTDRARQGAGGEPWRLHRTAVAIRGKGLGDHRLVRSLSRQAERITHRLTVRSSPPGRCPWCSLVTAARIMPIRAAVLVTPKGVAGSAFALAALVFATLAALVLTTLILAFAALATLLLRSPRAPRRRHRMPSLARPNDAPTFALALALTFTDLLSRRRQWLGGRVADDGMARLRDHKGADAHPQFRTHTISSVPTRWPGRH
ncbi:hypothetical protein SPHINGOT1_10289 [Sphingomonas sp. T1]|nr:hypothetical protein SPHINGOT1_10289 [Sphingomonas sp. T1]